MTDSKSFIDSLFPSFSSLKGIPDVIDKLKHKQAELENQAHGMTNSGQLAQLHQAAVDSLAQLDSVDRECADLSLQVRERLMGETKELLVDEPGEGEAKLGIVHELRIYTTQVQQLEQARKYLVLLLKIQELDAQVHSILARLKAVPSVNLSTSSPPTSPTLSSKFTAQGSPVSTSSPSSPSPSTPTTSPAVLSAEVVHDALAPFMQLMKVRTVLVASTQGPLALKSWVGDKIEVMAEIIVGHAKRALKLSLDGLGWPSPITIAPSKIDLRTSRSNEPPLRRSTATDRHESSPELQLLGRTFTDLLVLQSSLQDQQRRNQSDASKSTTTQQPEETLWVMDIMLEPILKRFKYHFCGKKATNRIDKPEWPLHHAKKIVQEHTAFLSLFIQNLLLDEGSRVDAKTEFVKGLMITINAKFRRDMNSILSDKHLLFHTVKELLAFEKHMRSVHEYPVKEDSGEYVPSSVSLPTCLDVLEDDGVFDLWLQAEVELGVESLYAHLSSPGAWETDDSSEYRAAKVAHMLLALLHSFTERFRYLKSPRHQLQFFRGTQLRLLEIFWKEVAVWREWKDWKDWREWWGSANVTTSARLIEMMEKWCVFANSLLLIKSAIRDWSDQLFFLLLYSMKLEEDGEREPESDAPLVGSIFDDTLKQYKLLQRQFVDALITNISSAFKRATTVYFKKKKVWGGQETGDISPELCVGLEDLAATLQRGATGLAPALFGKVWRGVASTLDSYVVDSLLPPSFHAFASGGAATFERDMHAMFLLFRPYTSHPDSHFKRIQDVINIISLPEEDQADLLARIDGRERDALAHYGIHKLDEEQIFAVCKMRIG